MQVYKTFFKILWKQKGQIIMYICIFMTISTIISSQAGKDSENTFESTSYDIAVFDYDKSEISKCITDYMGEVNDIVKIKDDDPEIIQDEIYNRNVKSVIRIPKGFEQALVNGEADELIEVLAIPGTIYSGTIESELDGLISNMNVFIKSGYSTSEAIKATNKVLDTQVEVTMLDQAKATTFSGLYYSYIYVAYVFILIFMVAIGPILMVFNTKNVRNRIACSSYKMKKSNLELILGMATSGIGLCVIFEIMAIITNKSAAFTARGGLYFLNMCCFATVSLGMTFLVGQLLTKVTALSMVSNIIGLGSSFLCGVFVPLSFLGDSVVKAAHFLPSYWYVIATEKIDSYTKGSDMGEFLFSMLMQLGFTILFIIIGMIIRRKKAR